MEEWMQLNQTSGDYDLSEFLEYLLQGTHSVSELDEAKENAYDDGYEAGKWDRDVSDDVLEQIQKAINILKEI